MRARNRLTAAFVRNAPPGKWCDGAGLYFVKRDDGGAQWVLRLMVHGRRREMGLGGWPDVSLAAARESAERWRAVARSGHDPIKERARELRAMRREDISLAAITADAFEARKAELKDDGKAGRWLSPLELHVLPKLGRVPVTDIDQRDIRDTLAPIWHAKADTARKAINRLNIVLTHAAALGLDVDLQATAKARALLGKPRHEPKHIPSMPWQEVPAFYASLAEPTITHLALRLVILTGLRSKAVRHLHLDQIDGDVWTVPAQYMKARKGKATDFRVPLSNEALRMIEAAMAHERRGFLFPAMRGNGVISDMSMSQYMKRRGLEARPHGFRATLRTWLAEAVKDAPHEVCETMIAHKTGGPVVQAYRRTDFLEQRRELAERWARYVTGCEDFGKVVDLPMRQRPTRGTN